MMDVEDGGARGAMCVSRVCVCDPPDRACERNKFSLRR